MVFFNCVQCAVLMCEYSFNTLGGGWGCLANPVPFQVFLFRIYFTISKLLYIYDTNLLSVLFLGEDPGWMADLDERITWMKGRP